MIRSHVACMPVFSRQSTYSLAVPTRTSLPTHGGAHGPEHCLWHKLPGPECGAATRGSEPAVLVWAAVRVSAEPWAVLGTQETNRRVTS